MTYILVLLKTVWASPWVKTILVLLIGVLRQQADILLVRVSELVVEAAAQDIPNNDRFMFALSRLREEFPDVRINLLRALIELAVMRLSSLENPPLYAPTVNKKEV